jgi:hypothetical protein
VPHPAFPFFRFYPLVPPTHRAYRAWVDNNWVVVVPIALLTAVVGYQIWTRAVVCEGGLASRALILGVMADGASSASRVLGAVAARLDPKREGS